MPKQDPRTPRKKTTASAQQQKRAEPRSAGMPIRAVSKQTGISTHVLRIWELRYGWPKPSRDANGYRLYPARTIELLSLVAAQMARGLSIGDVLKDPALRILDGGPSRRPVTRALSIAFDHIPKPTTSHAAQLREQLEMAIMAEDTGKIDLLMAQAPLIRPDERETALLAPFRHWTQWQQRP
jgi:DNA-binding transcriptional MerR regulator